MKKESTTGEGAGLTLKFWGVRGSTPTPHAENLGFGGNTPCIEMRAGSEVLIFDSGTGIRMLGRSLKEEFPSQPLRLHIFLTHFHWDHIQGLPFFGPAYAPENNIRFYSGATEGNLQQILCGHMTAPYFPVQFKNLLATRCCRDIGHEEVKIGSTSIYSFPMHHPQGASGYRIETAEGVVVYASDLEHGNAKLDSTLREFASGADVLIYDAMYTPEEYESHRGWGHSTWLEATKVAKDAGVGQLILFHHDPWHTDQMCEAIVREASRHFENTTGAVEGNILRVARTESEDV